MDHKEKAERMAHYRKMRDLRCNLMVNEIQDMLDGLSSGGKCDLKEMEKRFRNHIDEMVDECLSI